MKIVLSEEEYDLTSKNDVMLIKADAKYKALSP